MAAFMSGALSAGRREFLLAPWNKERKTLLTLGAFYSTGPARTRSWTKWEGQTQGWRLKTQNPMQTVSRHLRDWVAQQTDPLPVASEPPLRAELFSLEQLARHAKALAAQHQVVSRRGSHSLLARLDQNEQILSRAGVLEL